MILILEAIIVIAAVNLAVRAYVWYAIALHMAFAPTKRPVRSSVK